MKPIRKVGAQAQDQKQKDHENIKRNYKMSEKTFYYPIMN